MCRNESPATLSFLHTASSLTLSVEKSLLLSPWMQRIKTCNSFFNSMFNSQHFLVSFFLLLLLLLLFHRYTLTVAATDQDPDSPRSGTASLTITVLDLNDNKPVFPQPVYIVNNIVENEINVMIPVTATDADSGTNAMISYSIIAGNHIGTFMIGESPTSNIPLDLVNDTGDYVQVWMGLLDLILPHSWIERHLLSLH